MRGAAAQGALLAAALLLCWVQIPARAVAGVQVEARVLAPRAFGYILGDLLVQRVLLEVDGREVMPDALAQHERIGNWFERRSTWIERDADGHPWLAIEYQLVNVPPALSVVNLPALHLALKSDPSMALRVAAMPVSVAPLTPREPFVDASTLPLLRADRVLPLPARGPIVNALYWSIGALVLDLLAWLGWWRWRNWRASAHMPFARAQRALRGLDDSAPQAWQILHTAFDRTAGRAVQFGTLPEFFRRVPHLEVERSRIELFYRQSSALFFGAGLPAPALSVRALCADLRRLERRHER